MLKTEKVWACIAALLFCTCGFAADNSADTGPLSRELNMNAKDYILFKAEVRNLNKIGQVLTREQMVDIYKRIVEIPHNEPLVRALPLGQPHNYEYITPNKDFKEYQESLVPNWGDGWTYAPTYNPTYAPTWAPSNNPYTNYSPTGGSLSVNEPYGQFGGGFSGSGGVTVLNKLNSVNTNLNRNANGNRNGNMNGGLNCNGRKK